MTLSKRDKIRHSHKTHQFLNLSCGCDVEIIQHVVVMVGSHRWCVTHQVFAIVKSRMEE